MSCRCTRNAYIASTSSRTVEVDIQSLDELAVEASPEIRMGEKPVGTRYRLPDNREVVLLADGTPINFWNTEGMPDQFGDLIMCLLLLAGVEIASGRRNKPGIHSKAINQIAAHYRVSKSFLEKWFQE